LQVLGPDHDHTYTVPSKGLEYAWGKWQGCLGGPDCSCNAPRLPTMLDTHIPAQAAFLAWWYYADREPDFQYSHPGVMAALCRQRLGEK